MHDFIAWDDELGKDDSALCVMALTRQDAAQMFVSHHMRKEASAPPWDGWSMVVAVEDEDHEVRYVKVTVSWSMIIRSERPSK